MPKRMIFFFIALIFFSRGSLAYADVIINEVQLSPTSERFLELYNSGDSAVGLTGWYIQRKTSSASSFGSLVSNTNFEGKTINAHGYFVVSKFSIDNSDIVLDSLTLTESNTIQIKNSDGDVVDKVGWGSASDCSNPCPANPPDGQSIQKTDAGSWITADTTLGSVNHSSSAPPADNSNSTDDNSSDEDSSSATSSSITEAKTKTITTTTSKIQTQITANEIAFVGIPLSFEGKVMEGGKQIYSGNYFWNFGDGDFRQADVINNDKFTHTYFYPGEYDVLFEHYPDYFADTPDASSKIVVRVMAPEISISSVGDEKDFFIELSNNASYDADISQWIIASNRTSFTLPKNTTIESKKKMIISSNVTHFSILDKDSLKLMTPEGNSVFYYAPSFVAAPAKSVSQGNASITGSSKIIKASSADISSDLESPALDSSNEPMENLAASAAAAANGESTDSSSTSKNDSMRTYTLTIILTVFLGTSALGAYFIRRKKFAHNSGSDFAILDE